MFCLSFALTEHKLRMQSISECIRHGCKDLLSSSFASREVAVTDRAHFGKNRLCQVYRLRAVPHSLVLKYKSNLR
jgi:hypothetical protein